MVDQFRQIRKAFKSSLTSVNDNLEYYQRVQELQQRRDVIEKVFTDLNLAGDSLKRMEDCFVNLGPYEKQQVKMKLSAARSDYNKSRERFFKYKEQLNIQEQNENIFDRKTASSGEPNMRSKLEANARTLDSQGDQIHDIQKTATQVKEVSLDTYGTLKGQRGKLEGIQSNLQETNVKIMYGHRKIRTMQYREYCRKLLLYILIILLAVAIIIVLILKLT